MRYLGQITHPKDLVTKEYADAIETNLNNNMQSAVESYIEDALTEAKQSGEFQGEDGADGVSASHSWSGTTLIISSASGTSSANLQGPQGNPGYTPQRGTDYWTEADKAEIKSYAIEAILGGEW